MIYDKRFSVFPSRLFKFASSVTSIGFVLYPHVPFSCVTDKKRGNYEMQTHCSLWHFYNLLFFKLPFSYNRADGRL